MYSVSSQCVFLPQFLSSYLKSGETAPPGLDGWHLSVTACGDKGVLQTKKPRRGQVTLFANSIGQSLRHRDWSGRRRRNCWVSLKRSWTSQQTNWNFEDITGRVGRFSGTSCLCQQRHNSTKAAAAAAASTEVTWRGLSPSPPWMEGEGTWASNVTQTLLKIPPWMFRGDVGGYIGQMYCIG